MPDILQISLIQKFQVSAALDMTCAAFSIENFDRMLEEEKIRRSFAKAAARNSKTFVACKNGVVVGTARCEESLHVPDKYILQRIAVDPACRRQGIGGQLIGFIEKFIADKALKGRPGMIELEDSTKKDNPQSLFYEGLGYVRDAGPRGQMKTPILAKPLNS